MSHNFLVAYFVAVNFCCDFSTTDMLRIKRDCEMIFALSEKLFHDQFSSTMRHRCNGEDYLDTSLATVLSFRSFARAKL